ncbi:sensor domain-containing diguanylate cyclase [Paenibacillus sp.]|uniref:sensor domain-containing diguanylate cyclase n=1 Tax=Paenibacillus sp. TaxID=58172 RepID=UPI002D421FB2|nr:sensor domain-containing diguanylate cyclase [Paenibacillus sp.]HZG84458.1 sensor domain-containing diguanylate cyclase [Paenibacillus sp.]
MKQARFRGLKLHHLVIALVAVSVLLTFAVIAGVGFSAGRALWTADTLDAQRLNAAQLAGATDELFASLKSGLKTVAEHAAGETDTQHLHLFLDIVREGSGFNVAFIADENGFVLDASPRNLGLVGRKLTTVGALEALRERKALVSEPYLGVLNRLIVLISHPIFDAQGRYLGFAGGTISLHEPNLVRALIGTNPFNEAGRHVYVLSSAGNVIYHPDDALVGKNAAAFADLRDVFAAGSEQERIAVSLRHGMLAGVGSVPETDWLVVSQTPQRTVSRAIRRIVTRILLSALPLAALIVALIYVLVRFISSPLYKLARYAERLSEEPGAAPAAELPAIHDWNYEANRLFDTLAKASFQIRHRFDALSAEATTDQLTGLYNRRMMDRLLHEWERQRLPFCLLAIDADHFKQVNDQYGHQAGDEVLQFIARLASRTVRGQDVVCRYGGEEFVVLAPGADPDTARALAERLRSRIGETASPIGRRVTVSIGGAAFPLHGDTAEEVIRRADEALYRAKAEGRNRAIVHD